MNEKDILDLIERDAWMMEIIRAVAELGLPDWAIGAGFVRSKVWDHLHGFERTKLPDVDVLYFNPDNLGPEWDPLYEQKLQQRFPDVPWSVKNQARMHLHNNEAPYWSTEEAMSHWPETATAVAVFLDEKGRLRLVAPYGINDLVRMIVRPSPKFKKNRDMQVFRERLEKKMWKARWSKVTIIDG